MGRHEPQAITPSALRWRGIGFIVVAFFAALWATWAITTLMTPPGVATWFGYIITAIPTVALVAMGIHTMLRARHLQPCKYSPNPGTSSNHPAGFAARYTRRSPPMHGQR